MEVNGTFTARWVYESAHTLYSYPEPSPNKAGEQPLPVPSATFPQGAVTWKPREAIGAGPLLIKNGKYQNMWENELFDEASGVGPTYNHPRSAIAYHPNGYLIFFVCEGRNKTANTPGLTLKEVADLLLDLGCSEAINLDGGGSSCMLLNGKETIIPSDGKQRTIPNTVAIY
jgi:exopolysaccharide biosynthesis protein